jgi:hypothetical protein
MERAPWSSLLLPAVYHERRQPASQRQGLRCLGVPPRMTSMQIDPGRIALSEMPTLSSESEPEQTAKVIDRS